MVERIKWTDRTFEFDFPAGIYPELVERLRGVPARIEEHFQYVSEDLATFRESGRWSMQENAGHLLDLESLVQQRIGEYLAGATTLHAADMSNKKTFDASYNEVPISLILSDFRKARTETVTRLDSLAPEVFALTALHPRLNKQMRLTDMLFFQAEHDDYHLTRIHELRRLLTNR